MLLGLASLSAQQSNAERILSGRDTPSHDYDLIHQRIEVGNFDWDATAFDGNVSTTLVSLKPGLDSIVLNMGRRLAVRTVTLSSARSTVRPSARPPVQYSRVGDSIVVRLPRPAGFRDTMRLTIDYRGKVMQGRGLYFFKAEPGRRRRTQQVYSGGGTDGNPNWIPTYAGPHDKATWELIARVPVGLTVVSNGRLVSDKPDPVSRGSPAAAKQRTHTVHWRQERPASTYLVSLVVAPLTKVTERWRDIPLEYYVYSEDLPLARRLFGATPDMMEVFTRLTGVKYPWAGYPQTTVTDFIGGMENVGATTLVDWLPDARAYRDRPWYRHSLIPHELAHQWFGNLVTTENWSNYWLNEGMAEFMAGQYWGTKLGRHAEDDFYLDEYRRFLAADARRRVPLAVVQLQQRLHQGRPGPADAEEASGSGAVLGLHQPVSHPACLRQRHQRRSPARGALCHRAEPGLVLEPVDLSGGLPRVQRHCRVRFRRGDACADGAPDPRWTPPEPTAPVFGSPPRWSFRGRS